MLREIRRHKELKRISGRFEGVAGRWQKSYKEKLHNLYCSLHIWKAVQQRKTEFKGKRQAKKR